MAFVSGSSLMTITFEWQHSNLWILLMEKACFMLCCIKIFQYISLCFSWTLKILLFVCKGCWVIFKDNGGSLLPPFFLLALFIFILTGLSYMIKLIGLINYEEIWLNICFWLSSSWGIKELPIIIFKAKYLKNICHQCTVFPCKDNPWAETYSSA